MYYNTRQNIFSLFCNLKELLSLDSSDLLYLRIYLCNFFKDMNTLPEADYSACSSLSLAYACPLCTFGLQFLLPGGLNS